MKYLLNGTKVQKGQNENKTCLEHILLHEQLAKNSAKMCARVCLKLAIRWKILLHVEGHIVTLEWR